MGRRGPAKGSASAKRCGPAGQRSIAAPRLPVGAADVKLANPFKNGSAVWHEWDRVVAEMRAAGTYSPVYRSAIEQYCRAWEDDRTYTALVAKHGPLVKRRDGLTSNPAVRMRDQARARMRAYLNDFGLTSAGITRAEREKTDTKSALDQLNAKLDEIRAGGKP